MDKEPFTPSEDRVEQQTKSNPNHTEGQNNSALEIVERLQTAHRTLADLFSPFTALEDHPGHMASFIVQQQNNLVTILDEILQDPKEFHAEGFVQFDPSNPPEAVTHTIPLSEPPSTEELQSAILHAREYLIAWSTGLSQGDIPEKMREFLAELILLQQQERLKLAESFDSHNKS